MQRFEWELWILIEIDGLNKMIAILQTTWWRHQMEIFSALLALCAGNSPVNGEFPPQRPVTRSSDVFFDLRLSKQSWGWGFETPSRSLWRHRNDIFKCLIMKWTVVEMSIKLFLKANLTLSMVLGNNMEPNRRQAVTWANVPIHWPMPYICSIGALQKRLRTHKSKSSCIFTFD